MPDNPHSDRFAGIKILEQKRPYVMWQTAAGETYPEAPCFLEIDARAITGQGQVLPEELQRAREALAAFTPEA